MSSNHEQDISVPQASLIWQSFQKEILPYLLSILPDKVFQPGKESELFLALNKALYDKYVADGVLIPPDIQFKLQLDICSLMPAFSKLTNMEEMLKTVFGDMESLVEKAHVSDEPIPVQQTSVKPVKVTPQPVKPVMSGKVLTLDEVATFRATLRKEGRRVVATNGCFDLLHVGHLRYLTEARAVGDFLWVGLNGDASVRELKGPTRPIVAEADRAELLAAWRVVDAVTIFPEVRATSFLRAVQPDIYVKGGDYTAESLNPEEAQALRECGARIEIVQLVPGKSTSNLVKKMAEK